MDKHSELIFQRARAESAGSAAASVVVLLVLVLLLQTCMMRPDPCPDRPGTAVVQWSERAISCLYICIQ